MGGVSSSPTWNSAQVGVGEEGCMWSGDQVRSRMRWVGGDPSVNLRRELRPESSLPP